MTETTFPPAHGAARRSVPHATIRFAGDSGDGMQITGTQFALEVAWAGNDLATLPNYPAEIRAPQGTLFGVSSFQIQFGSTAIHTPGDAPDVLIAMNPAALKVNLAELKRGGIVIVNTGEFTPGNLAKAGFEKNPLDQGQDLLAGYKLYDVDVTKLTRDALAGSGLGMKEVDRCRNFFCLGLVSWLYNRPIAPTVEWVQSKFAKKPEIVDANLKALRAGHTYGEAVEAFQEVFDVEPAREVFSPGKYRQIMGNQAVALGLVAAATRANLPLVYGAYPITPASDILHALAPYRRFRVRTLQLEDEIAAVGAVIGAAFGGVIGVTGSSGPGIALKGEAIGLAVMAELPIVIVNVQRGGPSTGLPTKTEQADLLQAIYGRNGECPVVVLAAATPGDCFYMSYEAVRIALKYMTPVILLSDGYIANGSEPWRIPDASSLPEIPVRFAKDPASFQPYKRDPETLARPWAPPGVAGLEHRIGGLEKEDVSGDVCYDPENHEKMVQLREAKVKRVAREIPPLEVLGPPEGDLLVVGWGGTYGAIRTAVEEARRDGRAVSSVHIRHLNPLPPDLGAIMARFKRVLVPEINRGQLLRVLRSELLVDARGFNHVRGLPLTGTEIREAIEVQLKTLSGASS